MAISFTETERKAITRRLVRIPEENAAFTQAIADTLSGTTQYDEVDQANNVFFNFYHDVSSNYEEEMKNLDGTVAGTFTESDIQDSVDGVPGNLFFPIDVPTNIWPYLIPKITDEVNGIQAGTEPLSELNLSAELLQIIDLLKNGNTEALPASTLSTTAYTPGDNQIFVTDTTNFAAGESGILYDSTNFVFFDIDVVGVSSLTITEVVAPRGVITASGIVKDSFPGYSNTDREDMVAGGLLDIFTDHVSLSIDDIENNLLAQETSLQNNEDSRTTELAQNAAALLEVQTALGTITAWKALPNSGTTGKYTDPSLLPIETQAAARQSYIPTRVSEITSGFGSVIDNGDGTFSNGGAADDIYYNRYVWLDRRINRQQGSLQRKTSTQNSVSTLTDFLNNNLAIYSSYSQFFTATLSSLDGDGSNIISASDVSIFNNGDEISLISETQPEISGVILLIEDEVLTLSIEVPDTYLIADTLRIYKAL